MQDSTEPTITATTTRRTVLRTAGLAAVAVGGAAAVAACASDPPTTSPSPSTAPATSAPVTSAPASPSPSATEATETEQAEPPSGPSVATADVPVRGGVVLEDADYVVTQPEKGEYKAFSKICTHMGCPVARVAEQQIQCDCHQSRFSIADGSVLGGQASEPLPEYGVAVSGGKVYVQA